MPSSDQSAFRPHPSRKKFEVRTGLAQIEQTARRAFGWRLAPGADNPQEEESEWHRRSMSS